MAKVKIAIDISPTQDGNAVRGIGYFTSRLVPAMQQIIKTDPEYKDWQLDLIRNSKLEIRNFDLVHYPFFDPFKRTLKVNSSIPTIVTVYDLTPRQFKKHYPVGIKGELNWLSQKHQLKKTNLLVTCSHYSKFVISDLTGYPTDRIYVTPGAADPSFKVIGDKNKLKKISQKYHLSKKFVLFVGDIDWNKNIPNLVKACFKLKYPLVIVGSAAVQKNVPDHPWTTDLRWLQSQKSNPLLTLTGFVPDADLPAIFNLATIYCQPSYAEGFGLPLVQAMASACPTIFSQETSLPEISNFSGLMFNPYNPKSLTHALKKLWNSPKLQQEFVKKGLNRAKHFTWKLTARQTLAVYQLALLSHEK
ncbi:glycosyltransferase family 4 protein [Patescibacteria group bacterium]|nr:glycosyltransferase family 4 protein [Patescibacteria group bacterium]